MRGEALKKYRAGDIKDLVLRIYQIKKKREYIKHGFKSYTQFYQAFGWEHNISSEVLRKRVDNFALFVIRLGVSLDTFFDIKHKRKWEAIRPFSTKANIDGLVKLIQNYGESTVLKKLRPLKVKYCNHTFQLVKYCSKCHQVFHLSPEEVEKLKMGLPII